jgi:release factor glutamine methyltransferase
MDTMSSRRPNISELVRGGEVELVVHSVPNARRNAEWMLAHVLECRAADLYLDSSRQPSETQVRLYKTLLERRAAREPLQYILESTEFMSLSFHTVPGVFIPRPDTECVVEHAEAMLAAQGYRGWREGTERRMTATTLGPSSSRPAEVRPAAADVAEPFQILDLCCGSGVIAVSILKRLPGVRATALDLNADAVELTARNAALNGVGERIDCVCGDAFEFLASTCATFDMIVCNPPYIASGELAALPPEVRVHEPNLSLDGGADGVDFYRALCQTAAAVLYPGAAMVVEIGAGQGAAVSSLLHAASFVDISVRQDYAGCDRVVTARSATES